MDTRTLYRGETTPGQIFGRFDHLGLYQAGVSREEAGDVVVNLKLINALDESYAEDGVIKPESIRTVETNALVDTGAVDTVIPLSIAQRLGLKRMEKVNLELADGSFQESAFTSGVYIELLGRRVLTRCVTLGDHVLLGQIALEQTDLFVDCKNRKLVPNPEHPDGPVIRVY